jgi:predicted small secreted protein
MNEVGTSTALLQSSTPKTYTLANVKGNFSFQSDEWTANPSQPIYARNGLFTFDGKGNVQGSSSYMEGGGTLQTETFTGTYTVTSNGMGTISLSRGTQYVFVLHTATGTVANGLQIVQTNTTANIAICGIAERQ